MSVHYKHDVKRNQILRRDGSKCLKCGNDKWEELTMDHIVPVSLGGTNKISNLQTLCWTCNQQKQTDIINYRDVHEIGRPRKTHIIKPKYELDKRMHYTFRIECPKCHVGHKIKDAYVNQGFLKGKCYKCENIFFFKLTLTGLNTEVLQELPEDMPRKTLSEAQGLDDEKEIN